MVSLQGNAANIADRDGASCVLTGIAEQVPRIAKGWTESGYNGRFRSWAAAHLPWDGEIGTQWWTDVRGFWVAPGQEPPAIPRGLHVGPKRWSVERTCAWLGQYRRLSTDDARLPATSEPFVDAAMSRLMVRRLAWQRAAPAR